MKAILIDPAKREIKGIEVNPINGDMTAAFGYKKILLLVKEVLVFTEISSHQLMLCHDGFARPPWFWFDGVDNPIMGKAVLFGRENGKWPRAVTLAIKEIECLVRFAS